MELTQLLVVTDLQRSVSFYRDTLGADLVRTYGGTSAVLQFAGAWLLLVTGGGPTPDKPDVTFAPPGDPDRVSHELTIRVPDCQGAYHVLRQRGAEFLTPPVETSAETAPSSGIPTGTCWKSARPGNATLAAIMHAACVDPLTWPGEDWYWRYLDQVAFERDGDTGSPSHS